MFEGDIGLGLNVDGPRPSTAGAPAPCAALRLIEVQMVAMGRIVIGRQDRRKQSAGAVTDLMQEIRFIHLDRKSAVQGQSVSVRFDFGGRRIIKTNKYFSNYF